MQDETPLVGGGRTTVSRSGNIVFRAPGPWSSTVLGLLRHLEEVGFDAAPRVVGSGFDPQGRETVSFIDGEFVHPGPWQDEALPALGIMLKRLHEATASFKVPADAIWRSWFGRNLGGPHRVIGHCDTGPWNIVAVAGQPRGFIDWEGAGPVDPAFELAQACWLNAQLHDDDITAKVGLSSPENRARQVGLLLEGYGLSRRERSGFVDKLIAFAVHDAADQAIQAGVTADSRDAGPLWAVTWRIRSASWMLRHRSVLEHAVG